MKSGILFFTALLLLSSCSTTVFLTRTEPPELTLDPQPARIVFSNQFDYNANSGIKDKHEEAYRTAIQKFAETLSRDTLLENKVVGFVVDKPDSIATSGKMFEMNLKQDAVASLCRNHEADFLLSLDSLRLHFEWEVIREEDPMDGSVSKTKDFFLISNYYVTLYDPAGEPVKRTLLERSLLYTSRPTLGALITILPNLANAITKIGILARDAAMEYLGMFYSSEVVAGQRKLYTGKIFTESNNLIFQKEYDKAIGLLEQIPFSPSSSGKVKKIQHNLSVARELKTLYTGPD